MQFGGVGLSGTGGVHGEFGYRGLSHYKPVIERDVGNDGSRFPPY